MWNFQNSFIFGYFRNAEYIFYLTDKYMNGTATCVTANECVTKKRR
jgi:hypothetical protein